MVLYIQFKKGERKWQAKKQHCIWMRECKKQLR